jgi:hypothetical protein
MPLARYFVFTGAVLLALLLLLGWYLPPSAVEPARAGADHPTIQLQSAHKWPGAVVFDTTQPTIVPPPVTVAEQAPPPPPARSPLEALAMVQPKEPSPVIAAAPAAAPKRVVRRARVARPPPAPQIAGGYDMFGSVIRFRTAGSHQF